jgi:hypothetical protein
MATGMWLRLGLLLWLTLMLLRLLHLWWRQLTCVRHAPAAAQR